MPVGSVHLFMASLLTGSHSWGGKASDFLHMLGNNESILPFTANLNCSQLVLYSGYLAGRWTKGDINVLFLQQNALVLSMREGKKKTLELILAERVASTGMIACFLGLSKESRDFYEARSLKKNGKHCEH